MGKRWANYSRNGAMIIIGKNEFNSYIIHQNKI